MKRNDRLFAIELRNRGRVRRGTATVWRWRWIMEAMKARHGCHPVAAQQDADHGALAQGRARRGDMHAA